MNGKDSETVLYALFCCLLSHIRTVKRQKKKKKRAEFLNSRFCCKPEVVYGNI